MDWLKKVFNFPGAKIPEDGTIQSLIHHKKFHEAVKELIVLENMDYDDNFLNINTTNINSLYEKLEKKMSKVVLDSIVQVLGHLLSQVIKAIKKQESEDSKILKKIPGYEQKTPRKWKEKWMQWIEASVSEQISKACRLPTDKDGSCLSQTFCNLGKTFKKDLIHVINNVSPHYPAEFDVCNLYAQCYHKNFVSEIGSIIEYELDEEDTYFLLCWIHNLYPQTILRDSVVQGHIDESKLESLLPPNKIRKLERNFINCEVNTLETFLEKSLHLEVKRWKHGKEPMKVGRHYLSKLQMDVFQIVRDHIQKVAEICEEMSFKMASHLEKVLQKFLTSLVDEYTQMKKQKCFRAIAIANINCSWAFRNLLEDKDLRLDRRVKENLSLILNKLETLGYDALLQDMFKELKSRFGTLHHGKDHKPNFPFIMQYVKSCVRSLKPLCQPCFQVVIRKIHFQVVLEYVTRLMENPVRSENSIQLRTVAAQMVANENCINSYFSIWIPEDNWLYPLLSKLAEIIKLENLQDITSKLKELAEKYTDIRRGHICAILHMKGDIDRSEAKSILGQLVYSTSGENGTSSSPLFSLITPFSSQWLQCKYKKHTGDCCCISMFNICMTIKFAQNMIIHFCCKKFNVDTPPKYYPHDPSHKRHSELVKVRTMIPIYKTKTN